VSSVVLQNLTVVLARKLSGFARHQGLAEFLATPRTAGEVASRFSWNPSSTVRCLLALSAIGDLNFDADRDRFHSRMEKAATDQPSDEVGKLDDLFSEFELPSNGGVKRWLETGNRDGLAALEKTLQGRTPDEQALLRYYVLVVNQFLRKDVIAEGLRTNRSQARMALGIETLQIFDHYLSKPHLLQTYAAGFAAINRAGNEKTASVLSAADGASLLDIGGGHGSFARIFADRHPEFAKVDVYDLKETFKALSPLIQIQKHERVGWREGSFFETSATNPEGLEGLMSGEKYDFISLGWILHDWTDEQCVDILKKAKSHLKPEGRLVILEKIKPLQLSGRMYLVDFIMLLMADGYERGLDEYSRLFERAGFEYKEHYSNDYGRDVIQAVHRRAR
jgi:ubiquinone/menaquinone biosynthesis C-methylase UbiE